VLPRTRTIAATLDVRARTAGLFTMELVPTAAGDPLVPPDLPSAAVDAAILSAEAARLLGVRGGERIEAFVSRSVGERTERQRIDLAVAAVLPAVAFARPALFVPVDLLVATENYRDGLAVPAFGWPGREPTAAAPVFAGFRMFARSIDDVAGIEAWLRGHDIEVRTKAAEIETMKAFDRNLAATFAILAAIASAGYLLSLAASLWANIERKRRDLSILRLIGWQTLGLVAFPVFQAALTALLGAASAAGLFLLAQAAINRRFAGSLFGEESVCRLLPEHYLIAFAATLAAALAAASWSAWRASRIEPWEGLRDV
ncbi:MAG: FtsX-like permease family protein, partial [Rhodospirillales bacterium]|nr:FtsX-like permease family protein [Rhodospirillales bacterium]